MGEINLVRSSFRYNILIMKAFGMYPYDSVPWLYKTYALVFYVLLTLPTPAVATIHLIVSKETDINKLCDNSFLLIQIAILLVKLLPFKINPEGVKRTINTLNNKLFNEYTPAQIYLVEKCIKLSRINFGIFFIFCFGTFLSWTARAFLYEDKIFPMDIWLPGDPLVDYRFYCLGFAILVSGVGSAAFANAAIDPLIGSLICHAATQIQILKHTLEHLGEIVDDECTKELAIASGVEREEMKATLTYRKICRCMDHYCAVNVFVKDLEDTYSLVVFIQLLTSVLVICISCYELSKVEPLSGPFYGMIIFEATAFTEIFLFCYYGTLLYDESNTIVTAIYMSNWYTYDRKSMKALVTLMEMSKRPLKVTVGKLFDLSLTTYTTIIQRSYSLLAVLKNYG